MPALKGQDVRRAAGLHQPMKAGGGWVIVQCRFHDRGCQWTATRPDKPGYAESAQKAHGYDCHHRPRPEPRATVYDLPTYAATRGRRSPQMDPR